MKYLLHRLRTASWLRYIQQIILAFLLTAAFTFCEYNNRSLTLMSAFQLSLGLVLLLIIINELIIYLFWGLK